MKKGTRTVLSRHNFRRTYHGALAKLANPVTAGLRPTAARVRATLRDHGPLTAEQRAAAGAATVDSQAQRWTLRPATHHPLPKAVDLHGAHDFRHTFATWLEDAGIPARVIDELMGHEATGRSRQHQGSARRRSERQPRSRLWWPPSG